MLSRTSEYEHAEHSEQKLLDDLSKCIVAHKYKPLILKNRLSVFPEADVLPSSRRESRQPPLFFKAEVINLESGIGTASSTHVPLIIPIFTPREPAEEGKRKKRKFTGVEERKEHKGRRNERKYTMVETERVWEASRRLFEEFFVIGARSDSVSAAKTPENLFQYPNLKSNADW